MAETPPPPCNKCRRKPPSFHPSKHHLPLLLLVASALLLLHLRAAVTFLPLKDLRFAAKPLDGHTWFMSSTLDTQEPGHAQFQHFPSNASNSRILCLGGRDTHDGTRNSYAFAWPHALPHAATLLPGLAFVSYNHYDYGNIWHGLSAAVPFIDWHIRNGCAKASGPQRWILYHHGELRLKTGPWLSTLMEATFGGAMSVERLEGAACLERAVVMRHNEGGMSRERRLEVFDFLRCRARVFCDVGSPEWKKTSAIGMTLFMRNGGRSFIDLEAVVAIFGRACREVAGCRITVAYANNLTFCQQVMSLD